MGETIANQGELVGLCGHDGTDWEKVLIDGTKRLIVAIASCPLPTDAATSAKQLPDGHNVTVDNASLAVTGTFYQVTQPVSLADQTADVGLRRLAHLQATYDDVPGDMAWHELLSVSGPGVLEGIDFVSDHINSRIQLVIDGVIQQNPRVDTASLISSTWFNYLNLAGGKSCYFEQGVYDAVNDYYSIFLKSPIVYYTTLVIKYYAGSATAQLGLSVQYRGLE